MNAAHLYKCFGDKAVLEDVSLTVPDGAVVCLMAPSGRGKTTLLRCIAGLEMPDSGTVTGVPERVGFVFQEDRLCPPLELGLADCLDQRAAELSGGQRRRVSIARAVCYGPELLLLDEPFKGLDGAARDRTAQYLLRHRNGAAVLCVTHDRADAAALGAEIVEI